MWRKARLGIGLITLLVYLRDCAHVLRVLLKHAKPRASSPQEVAKIENYYVNPSEFYVDEAAFKRELDIVKKMHPNNASGLSSEVALSILRESLVFLGGGRAALLQLAHPYVAAALRQNSDLQTHGSLQRFQRTFFFMFKFAFGDVAQAVQAAQVVRRLHQRARGKLGEHVGMFAPEDEFDANHTHAILWVSATLQDTTLFMHELLAKPPSEATRDGYLQGYPAAGLMGVSPQLSWSSGRELDSHVAAVLRSRLLAVGRAGTEVNSFLWTSPSLAWHSRLALALMRRLTAVLLPQQVAHMFFGRAPCLLEYLFWSTQLAVVRFTYRLLPPTLRWLTPYIALRRRLGLPESAWAAWLSDFAARMVLLCYLFTIDINNSDNNHYIIIIILIFMIIVYFE
jgi:uncharacterized protein (DUF2236 family)